MSAHLGIRPGGAMVIALSLLVGACGDASAPPVSPTPTTPTAATAAPNASPTTTPRSGVVVKIGYAPGSVPHVWSLAADELGYFDRFGIEPSFEASTNTTARVASLTSGITDFVSVTPSEVFSANAAGTPLRIVLGIQNRDPLELLVRPGIESFSDLRGKVGCTFAIGGNQQVTGNRILEAEGLDPNTDVTWLAAGSLQGCLAALTSDRADFTLTSAQNIFQLQDLGFTVLAKARDYGVQPTWGLVTRQDVIDADPQLVRDVVEAIALGIEAMRDDREKGTDILVDYLQSTDRPLTTRLLDWYLGATDPGCPATAGLDQVKAAVAVQNPSVQSVPSASLVDSTFVKDIAARRPGVVSDADCG